MSSSQIFTIGTALRRAEDNGIPVEVLVQGQWLSGSVAGLDGDGLVLLTPEQIQCVVRNADISVVRLMARLPQDEAPVQPHATPYERVVRDTPAGHDRDRTREEAPAWAMPAGEADPLTELEYDDDEVFALDGGHDEVLVLHATADEGPLELEAPVLVSDEPAEDAADDGFEAEADVEAEPEAPAEDLGAFEVEAEDLAEDLADEQEAEQEAEEERTVFALPAPGASHEPPVEATEDAQVEAEAQADLDEVEPVEDFETVAEVAFVDEVDAVDETDTQETPAEEEPAPAGSATTGEEWRDMLIALRAEAPAVAATPAPERRRARRLVMR